MVSGKGFDHAVVIGGSIGGLLCTHVLARHFKRVTMIERDVPEATVDPRKGVPQGHHVHTLLKAGELVIEEFFPGIMDEVAQQGASTCDWATGVHWYHRDVWKVRYKSDWSASFQSRPLLEAAVRKRVERLEKVTFLYGKKVESLLTNTKGTKVEGVVFRCTGSAEPPEKLEADIVMDATGRATQVPRWLEDLGYKLPPEEKIKIGLAYVTREYKMKTEPPWSALGVYPSAPKTLMGLIFRIEGDRLIASLMGYHGEHAPLEPDAWEAHTRTLPTSDFYNAIAGAEALTEPRITRFDNMLRRRYERMPHFPEGLLSIGDAVCRFDPVFGQGMSVVAKEAKVLDVLLSNGQSIDGLARKFFKKISRVIDTPWLMVTSESFRWPQTQGKRFFGVGILQWYTGRVMKLSETNAGVYRGFLELMHLLKGPLVLFRPSVLFPVIKSVIFPSKTNKQKAVPAQQP